MKKIIAILMTLCVMASVLCLPTVAAEPVSGTVLCVSALKKDGTVAEIENGNFKEFAEGWEQAVDYARNQNFMSENGYERIVVDLLADWNANKDGEFGSGGDGFRYSTIYIPSDTRMTINLNGHTINRGLKIYEYDGEVICINDDADVIINGGKSGDPIIEPDQDPGNVKMGTITGGWSCNGAGGIHMQDGSNLTLNNVNIVGNRVDDDDGAGIAVYDGATLTMNGGCISHNISYNAVYGGGVYVDQARAYFTDVTFQDNQGFKRSTHGVAVYVDDGTLVMEGCKVIGNGLMTKRDGDVCAGAYSVISTINGSKVTIKDTQFLENGYAQETYVSLTMLKYTAVISSQTSYLTMENCAFTHNNQVNLIESEATVLNVSNSDFTGNNSFAFYGNCAVGFNSGFTNCKFSYNEPMLKLEDTFFFNTSNAGLRFVDCEFGEATFNNKSAAQFVEANALNGVGSIFGEGLHAMNVALLALIAAIVSICMTIAYHRKKQVQQS